MDLTSNITFDEVTNWPSFNHSNATNVTDAIIRTTTTIIATTTPIREWRWYGQAMKYGPVVVWVFGSVSNVMAFVTFLKKGLRESVTALLFRAIAVTDFLTLQETLTIWIQNFMGKESTALHTWGCRVGFFIMKSLKTISAWILVGVAVERFIGVCFPHRAKTLVTRTRAKIGIVGITLVIALFYIPCLLMYKNKVVWSHGLQRDDYLCLRTGNPKYRNFARFIFPWMEFTMTSGLPFLIMIILNSIIVVTLVRAARIRNKTTSSEARGPDTSAMTAMLLGVSIAFIVLTSPMFVYFLSFQFAPVENNTNLKGRLRFLFGMAFNLQHINHSINFFMYCLTGKKFREEAYKTFFFWCKPCTSNSNENRPLQVVNTIQ